MSIGLTVTIDWLSEHRNDENVKIIDASWHLPTTGIDGRAEYLKAHLPGAVYFDIDACATQTDLPHTLPSADIFAAYVSELGIANHHHVVVYDSNGWFSSARVWWMFQHFGLSTVSVLDGGLAAWKARGLPLDSGDNKPPSAVFTASITSDKRFQVAASDQVLQASHTRSAVVLDARPASRFHGYEKEFRPGLRSGHIPNSANLPFPELIEDGFIKSDEALRNIFASRGWSAETPVITSCGSGVTAAILILAIVKLGGQDLSLYDGSWSEWGADESLPIVSVVD